MTDQVDRWLEPEEMAEVCDLPAGYEDGGIESIEISFSPAMDMWHIITTLYEPLIND